MSKLNLCLYLVLQTVGGRKRQVARHMTKLIMQPLPMAGAIPPTEAGPGTFPATAAACAA